MAGLYSHADCTNQHRLQAGDRLDLSQPVIDGTGTLFRQTLYLQIPIDLLASSIVLALNSQLRLSFDPITVELDQNDHSWITQWDGLGDTVNVALSYPAPLIRLRSHLYNRADLHRVDGEAVAEQATLSVATGQTFSEPLTAPSFQLVLSQPKPKKHAQAIANKLQEKHHQRHKSLSAMAVSDKSSSSRSDDLMVVENEVLLQSGLSSIELQGQPTNPRLRLLNPDQSETLWQWLEPGSHDSSIDFPNQGEVLAEILAPALKQAFEKREPGSNTILLPLFVESDAPCHVMIEQVQLQFLQETELITEPISYNFDGSAAQVEALLLNRPAGEIQYISIEANADTQNSPWQDLPAGLPGNSNLNGAYLAKGDQIAIPWILDQPTYVSGISIAWYGLAKEIELQLNISPDSDDCPAARTLTKGSYSGSLTQPLWIHIRLAETALQPGTYWIQLQSNQGAGIWLGDPATAQQHIRRRSGNRPGQSETLPLTLNFQLLSNAPSGQLATAPMQLAINDTPMAFSEAGQDKIKAELAIIPPILQSSQEWKLRVSSSQSMVMSIQSVLLHYAV